MICPLCNYSMDSFDKECPRCHGKGLAAPQVSTPVAPTAPPAQQGTLPPNHIAPDDNPNFVMALIGFCIPLVGLILFLIERDTKPIRARSAGRGAALGFGISLVAWPMIFLIMAGSAMAPVVGRASANSERSSCQSNLKQAALSMVRYTQANNETYPDMSTMASMLAATAPYGGTSEIFSCPTSKKPFLGNVNLSNINEANISDSAATVLFYEADCQHLEGCNVAYADGHVKWLSESNWQAVKAQAGL